MRKNERIGKNCPRYYSPLGFLILFLSAGGSGMAVLLLGAYILPDLFLLRLAVSAIVTALVIAAKVVYDEISEWVNDQNPG